MLLTRNSQICTGLTQQNSLNDQCWMGMVTYPLQRHGTKWPSLAGPGWAEHILKQALAIGAQQCPVAGNALPSISISHTADVPNNIKPAALASAASAVHGNASACMLHLNLLAIALSPP